MIYVVLFKHKSGTLHFRSNHKGNARFTAKYEADREHARLASKGDDVQVKSFPNMGAAESFVSQHNADVLTAMCKGA